MTRKLGGSAAGDKLRIAPKNRNNVPTTNNERLAIEHLEGYFVLGSGNFHFSLGRFAFAIASFAFATKSGFSAARSFSSPISRDTSYSRTALASGCWMAL